MTTENREYTGSDDFQSIIASSMDGFLLVDMSGSILEVNESYCQLVGFSRSELINMHISQVDAIEDKEEVARRIEKIVRLGSMRFETRHQHKDGSSIDIEASINYSPTHGGSCFSFIRDITDRKRNDLALQRSEERYRNMVESQTEFVDRYLPGGILTYLNEALIKFAGVAEQDLLGASFYPFIHEADREEAVRRIESISLDNPVVETEGRIVLPDGRTRWNRWTHTGFFDANGMIIEYQSVGRDITERKEAEEALRESEERFRKILRDVPSIAVQGYAPDGTTQYWNRASEDLYGYRAEEAIGHNLLDLIIPPEMRRDVEGAIKYMAESGQAIPASELLLMRKDGSRVPVFSSHTIVRIPGREQELFCLDIDLSEQKNAEEALNRSMAELRAIYNNAPVMMCLVDQEQRILYANPAFSGFKGISEKNLVGGRACGVFGCVKAKEDPKGCGFGITCRDCTLLLAIQDTFRTGTGHQDEEHAITVFCDGELQNLTLLGSTALIDSGARSLLLLCLQDISNFKKSEEEKLSLEKQLLYAQKLESLGVMAGGIAHDFNNLLAVIIGHCSLVRMRPDDAEVHIPQIETAAERAAELCRQMLAYSGKTHLVQSKVDLKALVTEMVILVKSAISQNSEIKLDLADTIPTISGDASQIRQVVMNLIINASEAMGEEQGEIRVSLAKTAIQAGRSDRDHLGKTIAPGWYNCLEVSDTGCGMDAETRQRIFEPFYTTKFTGRGLGMSAVLGIITAHKGALQLVSQPGHGTTFKVYFPVEGHDSGEVQSGAPLVSPAAWKGSGTILLAEDEEQIQWLARTMLEELGFTVITAANGREGLDLYLRHAADIDLVVTDMGMPVMNGYEMFRELKKLCPDLPIIVSSGFGDADVTARLGRDDIAGLIGKPYNFSQLRDILQSVMGNSV